ncbi:MAG: hypothetical protein JO040_02415 [Gemmatimonadetes bacterium]|nr:hypothetical protein [Gemmatimonadota bacterium]
MSARLPSGVLVGLLAGVLFYLNALIPYSHAWPLLWPLFGGAFAVLSSARMKEERVSFGQGIKHSAGAGVVAGLLFFAATLPTLYALAQPAFEQVDRMLGAVEVLVRVSAAVALSLGVAALLGAAASVVGGVLVLPVARRLAH